MRLKHFTLLASAFILALGACSKAHLEDSIKPPMQTAASHVVNSTVPGVTIGDTSQNALDWPGTYTGTLPCADCEGIATHISIGKDLRYRLSETYLGKSDKPFLTEDAFTWNSDGNSITLQGIAEGTRSTHFQVGENQLTQLDLQGAKIEGALAGQYVLVKQP